MNDENRKFIAASDDDRPVLFLTCEQPHGTTLQNIEKDFWVCWTLDALFHGLPSGGPRLLFKGGTSLSKGYNLISRFSEDIDITVFRDDLGARASVHELTQLTKTARSKRLDGIRGVCQAYINDSLLGILSDLAAQTMVAIGRDRARLLDRSRSRRSGQTEPSNCRYPSVADGSGYVRPFVKIESGAKSALDPNESRIITPYLSADLTDGDALAVVGVTTIDPERTFLDKVLILHGLPIFFEKNKKLYGAGQVSRHYYDIHRMMGEPIGKRACTDAALVEDCVNHARVFFYRRDTGLEHVKRGAFRLTPSGGMVDRLHRDYDAMSTMIFGDVPDFRVVLDSVATAETWLNGA